jgi:hypothetical protein
MKKITKTVRDCHSTLNCIWSKRLDSGLFLNIGNSGGRLRQKLYKDVPRRTRLQGCKLPKPQCQVDSVFCKVSLN